jgi:putative ABC transport system ATP-binding protein
MNPTTTLDAPAPAGATATPARAGTAPIIRLDNVEKLYRTSRIETVALGGVNIEVARGEFISIMGPSGSGKSTLLHIMGLLDAPTSGTVEVAGAAVNGWDDRRMARFRNETIGFIFQQFHLVPDLSVLDNVEIPLLYRRSVGARRDLARKALERVGLSARLDHFPGQLSGGQQQRVAIARAIVGGPRIVLADEPTGNLDSQMGAEIMAILEELNRAGTTIVMVSHDAGLAARTTRTVRLFDGRPVQ